MGSRGGEQLGRKPVWAVRKHGVVGVGARNLQISNFDDHISCRLVSGWKRTDEKVEAAQKTSEYEDNAHSTQWLSQQNIVQFIKKNTQATVT